jgi:hypothetical protein
MSGRADGRGRSTVLGLQMRRNSGDSRHRRSCVLDRRTSAAELCERSLWVLA